ncbi:transposable element Tcb1 transposase [Trichonephila clavipes]|nr:transposable element Tcb1 transposase [Trichonephila clavipes]
MSGLKCRRTKLEVSEELGIVQSVILKLWLRVQAGQPPSTCLLELWSVLLDEWCNIPQDLFDNLIPSMPRRSTDCIASSGRHTMC